MAGIRYKGQIFSGAASFGDADHVAYDNTESGLEATDVQGALDEVSKAEGVSYDNTTSGLTATNVQGAVDEIGAYNTATAITIQPSTNVVIDENHSQKKGGYAFICVRGHVTANFSTQIFSFSGVILSPANYTIPIGVGGAWEITKAGYGFVGGSAFIAKLTSGDYFHIVATLPCT